MMSNKPRNLLKPKSASTNRVYSAVRNADNIIPKSGSSNSSRHTHSKRIGKGTIPPAPKNIDPPVNYHPWKLEYSQVFIREKKKKPMTKDRYTSTRPSVTHAKESIVTEEECCPILIPANAVHIEQPIIIHQRAKSSLPTVVRYLRNNELLPPGRPVPRTPVTNPYISGLQFETKAPIPVIGIAPTSATTDRLLNRATIRNDSSVIRRPPRRLIMNTDHYSIFALKAYG